MPVNCFRVGQLHDAGDVERAVPGGGACCLAGCSYSFIAHALPSSMTEVDESSCVCTGPRTRICGDRSGRPRVSGPRKAPDTEEPLGSRALPGLSGPESSDVHIE